MAIAIAVLLLLSISLYAQDQSAGAKVYVEETVFDFGWVPSGSTISHSYALYSRGTDSLKILKVKPG